MFHSADESFKETNKILSPLDLAKERISNRLQHTMIDFQEDMLDSHDISELFQKILDLAIPFLNLQIGEFHIKSQAKAFDEYPPSQEIFDLPDISSLSFPLEGVIALEIMREITDSIIAYATVLIQKFVPNFLSNKFCVV